MNRAKEQNRIRPDINVTPLIDVLLVLLIIFMVMTPLKPSRFKALIPEPPPPDVGPPPIPDPLTLVVTINTDGSLNLNGLEGLGTIDDAAKLTTKLVNLFQERLDNRAYAPEMESRTDLPEEQRVQKTVFIKAPRAMRYGEVVKVLDSIKGAGANPIGLQVDDLN